MLKEIVLVKKNIFFGNTKNSILKKQAENLTISLKQAFGILKSNPLKCKKKQNVHSYRLS